MMDIFEKLGLIGWFVGMVTLLVASVFGIFGLELVASILATIGCFGLVCGLIAFVRFVWRQ